MTQIQHITQLNNRIMYFSGRDLSHSICLAEEWATRHSVEMGNYYVQAYRGSSIIADYIQLEPIEAGDE